MARPPNGLAHSAVLFPFYNSLPSHRFVPSHSNRNIPPENQGCWTAGLLEVSRDGEKWVYSILCGNRSAEDFSYLFKNVLLMFKDIYITNFEDMSVIS
jgi:hypothetical protein